MTRIAYDVAADDRPDLEGKIINYHFHTKAEYILKAQIVGVNRAVGFTLVNYKCKHNTDTMKKRNIDPEIKYFSCYKGPVTAKPTNFSDCKCTWDEVYDLAVSMFEEGEYYPAKVMELKQGYTTDGVCSGSCAYGQ